MWVERRVSADSKYGAGASQDNRPSDRMAYVVCGQFDRSTAVDGQAAAFLDCEPACDEEAVGIDEVGFAVDRKVENNLAYGPGQA